MKKDLTNIESHAFSQAKGLMEISLHGSGDNLLIQSNGLHITSSLNKTLYLSGDDIELNENAFGNVDGGQLWTYFHIGLSNFPEDVFRLMLKSHYDKGHKSKF